jgi:hexosaminidase
MRRLNRRWIGLPLALLLMGCSDDAPSSSNGSGGSGSSGGSTGTSTVDPPNPDAAKRPLGSEIAVSFEVLDNFKKPAVLFGSQLTLANNGKAPLGNKGWALYFNFVRRVIQETLPPEVKVTHVNGDLFKLEPTEKFVPVQPKQSVIIPLDGEYWAIKETDAPAGYYFVFTDDKGKDSAPEAVGEETVKPLVAEKQTSRMPGDLTPVPTSKSRYAENLALSLLPAGDVDRIVPTPASIVAQGGQMTLKSDVGIYYDADGLKQDAESLAAALGALLGKAPQVTKGSAPAGTPAITLRTGAVIVNGEPKAAGSEAYELSITPQGVDLVGSDPSGVFYGIQSLRALVPTAAYKSPQADIAVDAVKVADAPRFKYRGMHLDVARNFQGKEAVKKLLDLMAFYKLNKFHFHLTDDEGWRLTIKDLPELTDVGGRRGHTTDDRENIVPSFGSGPDPKSGSSGGSGSYTRADFIEILKFAAARHIEVIPEIDVPGHARAAIKAMASRHAKLTAKGDTAGAEEFLLSDLSDTSVYSSVQMWTDNVLNPCRDSTYRFLTKVVEDVISMYTEAGATLTAIHTGGDEVPGGVWIASPACKTLIEKAPNDGIESVADLPFHFLRELSAMLAAHNLATGGWEEIGLTKVKIGEVTTKVANPEFVGKNFQPYAWNNVWGWGDEGNTYKLANAGYPVVMSNATNLYFDLAYDKDPVEPGYYWAGFVDTRKPFEFVPLDLYKSAYEDRMGNPINQQEAYKDAVGLTPAGKANVLGIQGQLWGENAKTPELMEHLAFPKLLGLSERAWAADPAWAATADQATRVTLLAAAWSRFANTLGQRDLPRLDYLSGGVKYRIPLPGARIDNGQLLANVAFPGLSIRYTTDGKEPDASSTVYTGPVAVTGVVKLKAFTSSGRGSRTAVLDPNAPGGS